VFRACSEHAERKRREADRALVSRSPLAAHVTLTLAPEQLLLLRCPELREFWIELAQKSEFLSDDALATQIETIGRTHARFRS
jgi:hypothetical protein